MPRLYRSRIAVAVLKKHGFYFVSQKGRHAKYRKLVNGKAINTTVPMMKKEIPFGTFHSILEQSGLREEDFK